MTSTCVCHVLKKRKALAWLKISCLKNSGPAMRRFALWEEETTQPV